MNYVFVDFEMEVVTREHKADRKLCRQEIIEIGAVLLNEKYEEIASFKRYVKPMFSESVSPIIRDLTGITTEMLADKRHIDLELPEFADWCASFGSEFKVFAWSENDLNQVINEMRQKNIPVTNNLHLMIDSWSDLQLEFDTSLCSDKHTSLSNALDSLGLRFEGQMHDALDDAHNTGRLYVEMSTSEEYKKDVEFIKNCFHDESKGTGITLGDLIDFSKFNFDFAS